MNSTPLGHLYIVLCKCIFTASIILLHSPIVFMIEVTPITYWSGLGNRARVRVRFYGYV